MKKALITASVFGFIGSFEKSNIKILLEQGYEVHVATNMSKDLKAFGDTGQLDGIDVIKHQISYSRSPLSLQTIKSYKAIKKLIQEENFDLIHCHTPVAAMLTRLAARKARKKGTKVIYTAHGFHFFKGAPILNWLIYFPVEYICSFFTDILITINQEDYRLAQRVMNAKKVEYIPGVGIDVEKFKSVRVDKFKKRKDLGIPEDAIMLLSVGELNKNKNHEIIIEAISKINDSTIYYCIAGQGELESYLTSKIKSLKLEERVKLLGFRKDVGQLYHTADIFCFPSLREGLGLAAIEAMACGLPLITSNIHGINDYSENYKTGFKCQRENINEITNAITILMESKEKRQKISIYNKEKANDFSIRIVKQRMKNLYELL